MAVVRLMVSFWKGLPNSLEPTLNSFEEFETYSKDILYRRIVFTIVDCYFCVIIIVLLVLRFKFTHSDSKRQGPYGILCPNGIPYPDAIPYFP